MSDQCGSCGMPMSQSEEFGGGKEGNPFCVHCCDSSGTLKSYEEVLGGMKNFIMQTMGVSEEEAEKTAKANMGKMPAWVDKVN